MTTPLENAMPLVTRKDGDTLIVLGRGAVGQLRHFLGEMGRDRAFLVTGPTVAAGRAGERVREALGDDLVGVFTRVRPHVPVETVEEASTEARGLGANVIVGLGGGSPIGTAKAAAFRLLADGGTVGETSWAVAAIPTTYAGSEVTPVFGTTDMARGHKEVVRDLRIRPRLALYDPELAVDTPPELTASTGINALAHCVEALYSKDAGDTERAMAVHAATLLVEFLPKVVRQPRELLPRYRLFEASMNAGLVLARAGMGVHHGLCHVLGGRYNAPHGVLNAIVLPHAMRFNIPVAARAYRDLAPSLGLRPADLSGDDMGEKVCRATADFIRRLGLPQRLRDLGIPKADLPSVAEEALPSKSVKANPRPVTGVADALTILEAAW